MSIKLFFEAIIKFVLGVVIVGLLLFLSGTFSYWQGWLLMGLLFIPMFIAGIIMMIFNPDLLRRRLNNKENEQEQKIVVLLSGIMFILGFILSGFNNRFGWFSLPNIVTWISSIIFIVSYILYGEILRENSYLLRTIEVEENQNLIDTGFYKIVRHPMYTITIFLFLSMPLVLGSIVSFFIFLIYPIIIIKRIRNEEKILERDLKGYKEYQRRVQYRLIPYIW